MKRREAGGRGASPIATHILRAALSKSRWPRVLLAGAAMLLLGCPSPYLERAIDPMGWSGGVGVEAAGTVMIPNFDAEGSSQSFVVGPVATARWRPIGLASFGLRGEYLWSYSRTDTSRAWGSPDRTPYVTALVKLMPYKTLAAKISLGGYWDRSLNHPVPNEALDVMMDVGQYFTAAVGIAGIFPPYVAVRAGITVHPRFGRHVVGHISVVSSDILSAGAGLGLDWENAPETKK